MELAIDLRLDIEESTTKNADIIYNLRQLDGQDRNDLVAQLCGFDSFEAMKREVNPRLTQEHVWEVIKTDLTPHDIRIKLLTREEQETLEVV